MKKLIGTLFCTLLMLHTVSCEKDDFCITNPVTPNLVLRFYDATNEDELKNVDSLSVSAAGKEDLYTYVSTDSIAIPLNTLSTSTVYTLSKGRLLLDTFTIEYTPEEDYVSRSCGYRVIFNNVTLNQDTVGNEDSWISSFTSDVITIINSQETAHVEIYH